MKKEKVEFMFYKELSKIAYEVIGTLTDLKLHSIVFLDTFDDDLFYEFCRFNFREFTRDLTVEFKHVNRSSKFRIDYKNGLYGNVYYYDDFVNASKKEKMKMLFEEFLDYECDDFEDETDEEYVEKTIIEYVEDLKTIVDVYETIDDFKQHQVEYWHEFLGDNSLV